MGVAAGKYEEWRDKIEEEVQKASAGISSSDKGTPELPPEAKPKASFDVLKAEPSDFAELYACARQWCPKLPSGYDIDDFDYVCRFVRGHIGYGHNISLYPLEVASSHHMTTGRWLRTTRV